MSTFDYPVSSDCHFAATPSAETLVATPNAPVVIPSAQNVVTLIAVVEPTVVIPSVQNVATPSAVAPPILVAPWAFLSV